MTRVPVLSVSSEPSNRTVWFVLPLWMGCSIALVLGCYQDAPIPAPQATRDLLITLLSDRDASSRLTASEALGKIGDQKAEPFLVRALHDSEPTVREAAARGVGRLSSVHADTGAELMTLLRDPDSSVRRAAAQALGAVEETSALASALADLSTDPDPAIRQAAGHALLLMEAQEAVAALFKGTTDTDPAVRQWAVAALGETGDARAVPALLDRLRHDSTAGVRAEAAYRLQFVGDPSVAAEMETIVRRDSSLDVQRWAEKSRLNLGRGSTAIQRLN